MQEIIQLKYKSKRLHIAPKQLKLHFEEQFSPIVVDIQPEVNDPELFPHILPPTDLNVNETEPTEAELENAIKTLKNNKCQGTDKVYAEQLRYSKSKTLITQLLLLLTTIWLSV